LANLAAYGERRDVRGVRQLLVCEMEYNATLGFLADRAGKSNEYVSNSLPTCVAS
jgi:hypothetical protein